MITLRTVENMKRKAKKIKKERHITHTQALDEQAKEHGFQSWALLMKKFNNGGDAA
jgi:hypothetical protein